MKKSYHLISMPSAQCHVVFATTDSGAPDSIYLFSYTTPILRVARMGDDAWELSVLYPVNCSKTTARHVNRFTSELFGRSLYHELKSYPHFEPFSELLSDSDVNRFWNRYEAVGRRIY